MCESCNGFDRRDFLKISSLASGGVMMGMLSTGASAAESSSPLPTIPKTKTRVAVVFLYPPAEVVNAGKMEDGWAPNHWFTYPGNQFHPEKNQELYTQKIREFAAPLAMELDFHPTAIYTQAAISAFIEKVKAGGYDALIIVNFWNTLSPSSKKIFDAVALPTVIYHPVGSNHQLPPNYLMNVPGMIYIHSTRNWEAFQGAVLALDTQHIMSQARFLRVGDYPEVSTLKLANIGTEVVRVPAGEYNAMFDSIQPDDEMRRAAAEFKASAQRVDDVTDEYILEGFRANRAVREILKQYEADAITIKCLMLKHRKPCIGFSLHNSAVVQPCACEDQPESLVTMMIANRLFGRGGFMHNPEFDINRNLYYGSHCTSPLRLFGPDAPNEEFHIRPFTHQLPKTAALDVHFRKGQQGVIVRYRGDYSLSGYTGEIVESPDMEVAGGCASRFLMRMDDMKDVTEMYRGVHPILYYVTPDLPQRLKMFANLCKMKWAGNY